MSPDTFIFQTHPIGPLAGKNSLTGKWMWGCRGRRSKIFDNFFHGKMHLDNGRNGGLQVKRHAGHERVLGLGEGTKMVAYVASKLMGSTEVLLEDNSR